MSREVHVRLSLSPAVTIMMLLFDSFLQQQLHFISQRTALMFFFKLARACINEKLFCSQGSAIKRNFPALYMLTYKAHLISINKHFRWKLL